MNSWCEILDFPIQARQNKPRHHGLTMVMDKGLGLTQLQDLLDHSARYIDMIKLGFGTSMLYPEEFLRQKIALCRQEGITIFPGGTFFEIAYLQNKLQDYFCLLLDYQFTGVEISDGTVEIPLPHREQAIKEAQSLGLVVITEIGKKDPRDQIGFSLLRRQMEKDLDAGAYKIIIEGRESGKGVMLYDGQGKLKEEELKLLLKNSFDIEDILWEAPLKNQQEKLISLFGSDVNLGNIAPEEILAVEALRRGLRGDTLRPTLAKEKSVIPLPFTSGKGKEIAR